MTTRNRLAAVLWLPALLGGAALAQADAKSQQAVRELEQAQARAAIARDRPALEKIFAADFRVINPSGGVADRDELFALLLGSAPAYSSAVYETQQVRDLGDTIVTIGLEKVVMAQGPQAGQTVQRRTTQVWHRTGGSWALKLRHANVVQ
jgi:uncharacterized protein (TIGR02246 family)